MGEKGKREGEKGVREDERKGERGKEKRIREDERKGERDKGGRGEGRKGERKREKGKGACHAKSPGGNSLDHANSASVIIGGSIAWFCPITVCGSV